MDYEGIEANYIAGTPYLGADVKMYPGPGGYQGELVGVGRRAQPQGVGRQGRRSSRSTAACSRPAATSSSTGRWTAGSRRSTRAPAPSCGSSTCASGIVGNPITYLGPDGKQYVAVYSGIGGWMGAVAFPDVSADDPYAALGVVGAMKDIKKYTAPGDTVYVFGL